MNAERPIRVLIVDDEPLACANLRVLAAKDPDVELVGACTSGPEAVRAILAQDPDVVFLDVEMSGMNGFDVLGAIGPSRRFAVIFVTAFEHHAVSAFDAQALDYILKPFDDVRFARALERAKRQLRRDRLEGLASEIASVLPAKRSDDAPTLGGEERIMVRDGERIVFVAVSELDWIEAFDYYVQLHVKDKAYLLRESMRDLEARLDSRRFMRIHRSAIVAIDRIAEVRPAGGGHYAVRLVDGTELKLSRGRRIHLRRRLASPP
jgi:two-component system LytT family response regulator